MAEEKEHRVIQDDEIDLVELAKTIWAGRRFIAKVTGVFAIIGLIIAFTSPIEYEASCKLLPESQETQMPNLGGLAGLAGLAGVDLNSLGATGSGVLTPQLYPEIVNSLPFIQEVMNDSVYFEQKKIKTTPLNYLKKVSSQPLYSYLYKYTIGLPGLIKEAFLSQESSTYTDFNDSTFVRISKEDWKLIESFKERLSVEMDEKTGIIEVVVEMPDPYAAAQIAKKIELMITDAVIKYKTDKALKNLEFIKETYNEAKINFEKVQLKKAKVQDRNKNITTAAANIELKNIEHEFSIAFDVYKGLSSQVEQAKIKLKEDTPVFAILEPVRIPSEKHKPKRFMILFSFFFIGLTIAITSIIFKKNIS